MICTLYSRAPPPALLSFHSLTRRRSCRRRIALDVRNQNTEHGDHDDEERHRRRDSHGIAAAAQCPFCRGWISLSWRLHLPAGCEDRLLFQGHLFFLPSSPPVQWSPWSLAVVTMVVVVTQWSSVSSSHSAFIEHVRRPTGRRRPRPPGARRAVLSLSP